MVLNQIADRLLNADPKILEGGINIPFRPNFPLGHTRALDADTKRAERLAPKPLKPRPVPLSRAL